MTEKVSVKKTRINFFLSEGDGFLFDAVMAAPATERSSTIRRLAQSGALIELMVSKGLPVMVHAMEGTVSDRAKAPSSPLPPSLQSRSSSGSKASSRANKVNASTPATESRKEAEGIGFDDVPIGIDFN